MGAAFTASSIPHTMSPQKRNGCSLALLPSSPPHTRLVQPGLCPPQRSPGSPSLQLLELVGWQERRWEAAQPWRSNSQSRSRAPLPHHQGKALHEEVGDSQRMRPADTSTTRLCASPLSLGICMLLEAMTRTSVTVLLPLCLLPSAPSPCEPQTGAVLAPAV